MDTSSVILAVASPPARAPRGVVRLSGAGTFDVLREFLVIDGVPSLAAASGMHPATLSVRDRTVRCLALVFAGPRSYTGEDAVELHVAGNPVLLERIIDELVAGAGGRGIEARRAEAGEFTARAYLNGRLDLIEAEAVAATIAARSDAELRAAHLLASGRLGSFARTLSDDVAGALALVEAGIDFTDQEDVVPIGPGALAGQLEHARAAVRAQLDRAVGTEQLEAIPTVVLTGSPNAGKSTLFNALLGRTRAVVSSTAGTTRDALVEPLVITTPHGPAEVLLVDLAGAETARSTLDQRMQSSAREAIARADLVVHCVAPDAPHSPAPRADGVLVVRTKADLHLSHSVRGHDVSGHTREGLDDLLRTMTDRLADRAVSIGAEATVLRPRHDAALRAALDGLDAAATIVEPRRDDPALTDPELIASALRAALDALTALAGRVTPDDVLGRIFSSFCVGK